MLLAKLMVAADDAAFEQAPNAFDAIRMNVSAYPFLSFVIDRLMVCVARINAIIDRGEIGIDTLGFRAGILLKKVGYRFSIRMRLDFEPDRSATLDRAHDGRLVADVACAHAL